MTTQQELPDGLDEFDAWMRTGGADPAEPTPEDRARRRWRRLRGLVIALVILAALVGAAGGYAAWALNAPLAAPAATATPPPVAPGAAVALALPADGAAAISVSGADAYLGPAASGIWQTSGTNEPRPLASISKLITALVVLEARPLSGPEDPGPTITFSEADNDLYDAYYVRGATIARMPTGSSMSEYDALATMLIPSASNYAEAVSTWAFGSQSSFVSAARGWLARNGLSATTMVEPTGIDPRNTSTPTDLISLGKIAAANPVIARIAGTASMALPGTGVLWNTNDLLGTAGITGLKTGNLGEGRHNLLYTAELTTQGTDPLTVTGVMMGGASHESVDRSVVQLLDSIRLGFHDVPVAEEGQGLGTFTTPWGSSAQMVVGEDASIFTWSDTPITVAMDTRAPSSYADGEVIGTLTWTAGPNTATVSIVIEGSIEAPTGWWRLTHPSELGR